jgi:hypothetical protein
MNEVVISYAVVKIATGVMTYITFDNYFIKGKNLKNDEM